MRRTEPIIEQAVILAKQAGTPSQEIARQVGVSTDTVNTIVRRNADLPDATKAIDNAYLSGGFKYMWAQALDKVRNGEEISSQDMKNYGLVMAISLDKMALISGFPTAIVAHLHEHRHEMGNVASKLAEVAQRMHVASSMPALEGHDDTVSR